VSSEITRHDLGVSWVVREPMSRASHALAADGRVWLVDPVDDPDALAAAAALGEPAAVLQLLDRHNRDSAAVAERLGVPLLKVPAAVPDAPFEVVRVLDVPGWHEVALWWPEHRGLVVAEVVGTAPSYAVDGGGAGIHPVLRLFPPGRLRTFSPAHLLVGHGPPLHGDEAAAALEHAYARSRRDVPRLVAKLPGMLRAAKQAARR
jgi:hypothetical protein